MSIYTENQIKKKKLTCRSEVSGRPGDDRGGYTSVSADGSSLDNQGSISKLEIVQPRNSHVRSGGVEILAEGEALAHH